MNEREALLANVLRVPGDDTARLVFADWLEENGESERAEVIRLQVWHGQNWPTHRLKKHCACRSCKAFRRENTIFHLRNRVKWAGPAWVPCCQIRWYRGFIETIELPAAEFMSNAEAIFRAHPVTAVVLVDKEPYPRGGERCFWAHPSVPGDGDYASVPVRIFLALDGYENRGANKQQVRWFNSRRDALAALSRACVKYGRALAGLPPLAPA